jgi:hypothetical protein
MRQGWMVFAVLMGIGALSADADAAARFIDGNIEDFRAGGWPIDGDLNAVN